MSAVVSTREIGLQWRSTVLDEWRVDLADAIVREISRRRLTAAEVARICGYSSVKQVGEDLGYMKDRFRDGEGEPGITRLLRYAHYLGVPVSRSVVARAAA